ncbi:aromatic ring-hydroxylating dioxygenase subunit alpha, partial [Acidovorax cavernicola]
PETDDTCHYFWSISSTRHPDMPDNIDAVIEQTAFTFDEDRTVIEAQYRNMREFGERATWTDIHVDVGGNRARRIVAKLLEQQA